MSSPIKTVNSEDESGYFLGFDVDFFCMGGGWRWGIGIQIDVGNGSDAEGILGIETSV